MQWKERAKEVEEQYCDVTEGVIIINSTKPL